MTWASNSDTPGPHVNSIILFLPGFEQFSQTRLWKLVEDGAKVMVKMLLSQAAFTWMSDQTCKEFKNAGRNADCLRIINEPPRKPHAKAAYAYTKNALRKNVWSST